MSAGTEIAFPLMPGMLFRAAHASSHALPLRDVMKTLEQPAWSNLAAQVQYNGTLFPVISGPNQTTETHPDAACNPSPLEPPVTTATLPSRAKMDLKSSSLTSASADMFVIF